MENIFEYYYNIVPGKGAVRNNLVYTSLISKDKKTFCQWYYNDTDYHKGKNKVVDPSLMEEKWTREVKYLTLMQQEHKDMVPEILEIDHSQRKIFLAIDGVDFWQRHYDDNCTYDQVLPTWREQILAINQAHKDLGLYKYSTHPSSYFVVEGQLKCINYFFTHAEEEKYITVNQVISHISEERLESAKGLLESHGLTFDTPIDLKTFQMLIFESFKTNYPEDFAEDLKKIYR